MENGVAKGTSLNIKIDQDPSQPKGNKFNQIVNEEILFLIDNSKDSNIMGCFINIK